MVHRWRGISAHRTHGPRCRRTIGKGGELSVDRCTIDDEYFFVRGLVEIPIVESGGVFAWGVWISLSKGSFERACELWDDSQRVYEPTYFGWFCNSVPGYPETLNLKTAVHSRSVGTRPYIELEATEHPLAAEQRNGITMIRVRQIAERMHHHNSKAPKPKCDRPALF